MDGKLIVWDANAGRELANARVPVHCPVMLAARDGECVVLDDNGSVRRVSVPELRLVNSPPAVLHDDVIACVVSRTGEQVLAIDAQNRLYFDIIDPAESVVAERQDDTFHAIAISHSGSVAAFACSPNRVTLLSTPNLSELCVIDCPVDIASIDICDTARLAAVGCCDGSVRIYELQGNLIESRRLFDSQVTLCTFSGDGRRLIAGTHRIAEVVSADLSERYGAAHVSNWVRNAEFSSDGSAVLIASEWNALRLFSIAPWRQVLTLEAKVLAPPGAMIVEPSSALWLASVHAITEMRADDDIRVSEVISGLRHLTLLEQSANRCYLAHYDGRIQLIAKTEDHSLDDIWQDDEGLECIATDPAEQFIAIATSDGNVIIWDMSTDRRHATVVPPSELKVKSMTFSGKCEYLAIAGRFEGYLPSGEIDRGAIASCDIGSGETQWLNRVCNGGIVKAFYCHKNDSLLFLSSNEMGEAEARSGDRTWWRPLPLTGVIVGDYADSERLVAFGSATGHVGVQRAGSDSRATVVQAHFSRVTAVMIHANAGWVVSCSEDGAIKFSDLVTLSCDYEMILFSGGDRWILLASDGRIAWRGSSEEHDEVLRRIATRRAIYQDEHVVREFCLRFGGRSTKGG